MPIALFKKGILIGILFLIGGTPTLAIGANTAGGLTNYFDAGRAQRQVQQSLPRSVQKTPNTVMPAQPAAPTKTSQLKFKLTKIMIVGSTIYPKKVFQHIFAPSINHIISLEQLQNMVHQITAKYRQDGYILSRAILPPQTVTHGIVKVQIVEGFISSVTIRGEPGSAKTLIEAYGKHVMETRPLQIHRLQRYALLANDLPGFTVESVLVPSKNVPEGSELILVAKQERANVYMSYDNFGSRYIGPLESTLGVNLNSLIVPGDTNNLQITTTTRPNELRYAGLSHTQPIGTDGLRWQIGTTYVETQPSFIIAPLNILGRNVLAYTNIAYPWIRDRDKNLTFHASFNYQNVNSTILGEPFYQDRIRSLVLSANFDNIDRWRGINTAEFDVTHGFPILGAAQHFYMSRPNGTPNYTRLNLSLSRLQALFSTVSLFGAFHGQYAYQPLLATEQFGIGGSDVGRGYDSSEVVGDNGVSFKIELRLDTSPFKKFLQSIQYYAFYDAGMVWNIDTVNFIPRQTLSSVGIGAHFTFLPQLTANLYIAKPLDHPVAALNILGKNDTAARVFFQISATS